MKRLLIFACVGVAGAAVHIAGFELANRFLQFDKTSAWLLGFALAATATWMLNRAMTFSDRLSRRAPGEWALYVGVAALGALAHFVVFRILALPGAPLAAAPGLGIIPGSLASFVVTYLGASLLVFPIRRKSP